MQRVVNIRQVTKNGERIAGPARSDFGEQARCLRPCRDRQGIVGGDGSQRFGCLVPAWNAELGEVRSGTSAQRGPHIDVGGDQVEYLRRLGAVLDGVVE